MAPTEFVVRLLVAQLLGAAIGVERQWRQRIARLRTNALVATGAALFVMLGSMIKGEQSPTRIASYVVYGIGFLGGGVILRAGFTVRGLNTAATLWCAAAVGCLAGWGFLPEAAICALSIIGANVLLRPLAMTINRQPLQNTEVETLHLLDCLPQRRRSSCTSAPPLHREQRGDKPSPLTARISITPTRFRCRRN